MKQHEKEFFDSINQIIKEELTNKQILNNHQYSPRWMVLNKNILLSRWVESDCQKRESWPVGY